MVLNAIRCLVAAGALCGWMSGSTSGWLRAEDLAKLAPIPRDPLELVTGRADLAGAPESRTAALELVSRARKNFALRTGLQGYDLKVHFTVDSGGVTEYDGAWQMEDIFDPKQGLHWTAKSDSGYTITEISLNGKHFAEGTPGNFPLRLQEARGALLDAIPSSAYIRRRAIRTSTAVFDGAQVVCVLYSSPETDPSLPLGRRWDETEECIDSQSGLLKVQSQTPGRYFSYDYTNAPTLAGHILPRAVTVTEGGKVVSKIFVDTLEELPSADPSLFVPTPEMKERGQPDVMAGAQKIWRVAGPPSLSPGGAMQPVCVFGLVTPSGDLVEAHTLQPSDPHSAAAVEAATHMSFPAPPMLGRVRPPAQQHLEFVFVSFASSR
jgi:hypothetical protein